MLFAFHCQMPNHTLHSLGYERLHSIRPDLSECLNLSVLSSPAREEERHSARQEQQEQGRQRLEQMAIQQEQEEARRQEETK